MTAESAAAPPVPVRARTRNAAFLVIGRLPVAIWGTATVLIAAVAAALATLATLPAAVLALASRVLAGRRRRPFGGERRAAMSNGRLAVRALAPWAMRLRGAAAREREVIAARTGVTLESGDRPLPDDPRAHPAALVADPATRRSAAYFLLTLPLATLGVAALLAVLVLGVMFTTLPLYAPLLDFGPQRVVTPENVFVLEGLDISRTDATLLAVLGVVLLLCASGVARMSAAAIVGLARWLLTPAASTLLAAEVAEQRARRQLAIAAAEAERRRIERDLHDGAQQRLTALAISIGRAKERLAADPGGAATLLDEAHAEAKRASAEIRELARGIHPAILTDRGLDAALSTLASRAPFPVHIVTDLPQRPPQAVESAAYFMVAEALTNVARHAAATKATVGLVLSGGELQVTVVDDGRGGATPARGSGLTGLAERAAALGGRLTVDSPPGGPTVMRAVLPCAS